MAFYRIIFLLFSCFCCVLGSCKNYHRNKTHAGVSFQRIQRGEALAHQYCQSCHLFPEPYLLNSKSWDEGVLPVMGPMLGIFTHNFQRYPSGRNDKNLNSDFYPSSPLLGNQEWQNIIDFYTATSPDSLGQQERKQDIKTRLPFFQVQIPTKINHHTITYLKIVTSGTHKQLLVGDQATQSLLKINSKFEVIDSLNAVGTIVDTDPLGTKMLACDMGPIIPTNGRFGRGVYVSNNSTGKMQLDSLPLFKGLARPVQIVSTDLDNDGKTDYVICEFGFMMGSLSWYKNMGNDSFQRKILRAFPGALKLYVQDYNRDGLPDLWVLFAQGDEGVFLFTNKGKGQFEQRQVLRFPPVYGSTSFELADFNKDGLQDIIYTCGDNADYSKVLKPYHGVYIFLNDGHGQFKQKYFFPMNGCYKAIARDFDQDGDLDIAAISFFADYEKQPDEGFVYLENKGDFTFQPYGFPESRLGRWLTLEAGDFDGDGKTDLILGNFAEGPVLIKPSVDWKKGPAFILLKNVK